MIEPNDPDAHVLIVDDDERIRTLLQKFLARHGYWVTPARDAAHARNLLTALEFDLLVIDVMMPGEDGFTFTKSLRETLDTPILLLTAKGDTDDRIVGLEAGADDYLPKPQLGPVRYDISRGEMWEGEKMIRLTATESALMRIFSARTNEPISRTQLVEDLGRDDGRAQERAIDVQITRLRRKIEADPKQPRYLQTVRGAGYMLAPD